MVGPKGFEPMTSALSKQRSKPTELRSRFEAAKIRNDFGISKYSCHILNFSKEKITDCSATQYLET